MNVDRIRLLLTLLVLGSVATGVRAGEGDSSWLSGWKFRQRLDVRAEVVLTELTNFPVLVRLNAANFNFQAGKGDGSDVRFALPDGTLLAYDREQHDSVNGNALYWVRLPLVSATQNTTFHLYYGKASASNAANSHDVWTANYVGVWHLNEGTNAAIYDRKNDSSTNNLHAIPNRVYDDACHAVPAMIGKGILLDGHSPTGGFLRTDNVNIDTTQGLTFSAWVKPHSVGSRSNQGDGIISIGGGSWDPYFRTTLSFYTPPTETNSTIFGYTSVWVGEVANAKAVQTIALGFTTGVWHHAVATFYCNKSAGATNSTVKVYLDGQKVGENSVLGFALRNPLGRADRGFYFGAITNAKYPGTNPINSTFDGILDETQIAGTVRSDAWIKASYLNQKAVDGLLVYGAVQQPGMCFVIR